MQLFFRFSVNQTIIRSRPVRLRIIKRLLPHFGHMAESDLILLKQQVAIVIDHGQETVEVMSDSSGHPANAFHFLGLVIVAPRAWLAPPPSVSGW
jgi:hypothetical protein